MKVLLFTGYGGATYTPKMKEIMKKYKGIRGRIGEVIEYVESQYIVYGVEYKNIMSDLKTNKELIVSFHGHKGKYFCYDKNCNHIGSFSIVDVDTSRPWTIEEYDGSEYIKYLDEKKLVDKELNYWS